MPPHTHTGGLKQIRKFCTWSVSLQWIICQHVVCAQTFSVLEPHDGGERHWDEGIRTPSGPCADGSKTKDMWDTRASVDANGLKEALMRDAAVPEVATKQWRRWWWQEAVGCGGDDGEREEKRDASWCSLREPEADGNKSVPPPGWPNKGGGKQLFHETINLKCFGGCWIKNPSMGEERSFRWLVLIKGEQTSTRCAYFSCPKRSLVLKKENLSNKTHLKANDGRESAPIRHPKSGSCQEPAAGDDILWRKTREMSVEPPSFHPPQLTTFHFKSPQNAMWRSNVAERQNAMN